MGMTHHNGQSSNGQHDADDGLTPQQKAFLAAYALVGTVTGAASASKTRRTTHYLWVKQPEYARAFADAQEEAADRLEAEAITRATEGLRRYKFSRNGEPLKHPLTAEPYYEDVRSDILLIFLLKGLRPEKFGERLEHRGSVPVSISEDDARRLERLAESIDDDFVDMRVR
jgi:hypothetical protein